MSDRQTQDQTYRPLAVPRWLAWFDVRGRRLGLWAFALNRLTGIGLVVYLGLHLVVLSLLLGGEAAWDDFIALARSPVILVLDVVLIAGLLIHGLNGVRVALVGLGIGVRGHKPAFVLLMAVALAALIFAAVRVFTL